MAFRLRSFLAACGLLLMASCNRPAASRPPASVVRCAVIGGMTDTQMFVELGRRFHADTGLSIEIVATGPKDTVAAALRAGEADLVTMHSSDTMVNLVADGYALDPQPWVKNDQIIVGHKDDPAGIRGMTDAVAALRKIASARAPFVVHSSLGSQEVLRDVCHAGGVDLAQEQLIYSSEQRKTAVLQLTDQKRGYTLVGRIPFLDGKLFGPGLVIMVQGDERLRRPYLAAVANPRRFPATRMDAARALAAYLRSPATQQWLLHYGEGKLDNRPLFFPVDIGPVGTTRPSRH
ncbi:MAG: substrate-binding domain-containing protein [Tepidisphaerales bacterium]